MNPSNPYYYLNLVERGIITAAEVYDALIYFKIRQRLGENQKLYREDYELDDIEAYKRTVEY